jgi:predicted short-subunit dehydrogenase-like oxidoreductase (DUF2520 family)
MRDKKIPIIQIFSRKATSAKALASRIGCAWTNDPDKIRTDAALYIFAVRDDVLVETIGKIPPNGGLWVHTAGSMPMDIFGDTVNRYGVFYPMQTFSKARPVSFHSIPIFIEASSASDGLLLQSIAACLSREVHFLSSEQRQQFHLAAVFASSFTNRMYAIACHLLERKGLDGRLLLPLIDETAAKVHDLPAVKAQTGPAVRHDVAVMKKHLDMLDHETDLKELYRLISRNIHG